MSNYITTYQSCNLFYFLEFIPSYIVLVGLNELKITFDITFPWHISTNCFVRTGGELPVGEDFMKWESLPAWALGSLGEACKACELGKSTAEGLSYT